MMGGNLLRDDLYNEIVRLPVIDVHSHLSAKKMTAGALGDVLFYHMLLYPLRASGVDQNLLWPDGESIHHTGRPYEELIRNWPRIANTGFGWILRTILRELYDFDTPITHESLAELTAEFARRIADPEWAGIVIGRGNIKQILSSNYWVRREGDVKKPWDEVRSNDLMRYTVEMAPEIGTHEYITWKERFDLLEKYREQVITSVDTLDTANGEFYDRVHWPDKHALVWWVSSLADFKPVDDSIVNAIITRSRKGEVLDAASESIMEAAFVRSVCRAVGSRAKVLQLVYGTQFITRGSPHPIARTASCFTDSLGYLLNDFPNLHFNILSGYEPDEPLLCALCLGYPNVSLGGFWWQTFYPAVMHSAWHRRLDMVPTSKLAGFFSDGYCVDWMFGRLRLTQRVLANVLAEKIDHGFIDFDQGVGMARDVLHGTPGELFLGG